VFQARFGNDIGLFRAGYDTSNSRLFLSPIDSTSTAWSTNGADPTTIPTMAGTYTFPIELTLWTPITNSQNSWC